MNDHDKQIQKDTQVLYPLSSDFNGLNKKVAYCPSQQGFNAQWGQNKLDEWKNCLLQDPRRAEGRTYITVYNGFEGEWEKCVENHSDSTPVTTKLFDLCYLYAKRDHSIKFISHGVKANTD